MIGAALRTTPAAIPAATAAPTSRSHGSSILPSPSDGVCRAGSDAATGMIASRGSGGGATLRSAVRGATARGSDRPAGGVEVEDLTEGWALGALGTTPWDTDGRATVEWPSIGWTRRPG